MGCIAQSCPRCNCPIVTLINPALPIISGFIALIFIILYFTIKPKVIYLPLADTE
jgi:hypothetical protein